MVGYPRLVRALLGAALLVPLVVGCSVGENAVGPGATETEINEVLGEGTDATSVGVPSSSTVATTTPAESEVRATSTTSVPTPVSTTSEGSILSVGSGHACWIPVQEDLVECWGVAGAFGAGVGWSATGADLSWVGRPTYVESSSALGSCAIASGSIFCWDYESLEGRVTGSNPTIADLGVLPRPHFVEVHLHSPWACGLQQGGELSCFLAGDLATPNPYGSLSEDLGTAAIGTTRVCGITRAGGVECWKQYVEGEPQPFGPSAGVATSYKEISIGRYGICAIGSNNLVECWDFEQDIENTGRSLTNPDSGLRFVQIDVGDEAACGLAVDGSISCWGEGPVVSALPASDGPYEAVDVGVDAACAVPVGGKPVCWGDGPRELLAGPASGAGLAPVPTPTTEPFTWSAETWDGRDYLCAWDMTKFTGDCYLESSEPDPSALPLSPDLYCTLGASYFTCSEVWYPDL